MKSKKAQMEIAIMKGIVLSLFVLAGFLFYEKAIGETSSGEKIECNWACENIKWGECVNGYQTRNIGECTNKDNCNCKCVTENPICFEKSILPEKIRPC